MRFVHLPLLILLVTGCSTRVYDGPKRPRSEVAVIVPNAKESRVGIVIAAVGIHEMDNLSDPVEILPGETRVEFHVLPERPDLSPPVGGELGRKRILDNFDQALPASITFTAEPGRTYAFDGRYDTVADRAAVQVVDRETRRVVGETTVEDTR